MLLTNSFKKAVCLCSAMLWLMGCSTTPTPLPSPSPTATQPMLVTLPPTSAPPTALPSPTKARVLLTTQEEIPIYAGPARVYRRWETPLAANLAVSVLGRDKTGAWVQIHHMQARGWVQSDPARVHITGHLDTVPIVPVPPVTVTPSLTHAAGILPTATPPPTFTPFADATLTRPAGSVPTKAPQLDDHDSFSVPSHNLGILQADFSVSGTGTLSLLNDVYDYIGWQIDPSLGELVQLELEFACDNANAEIVVSLHSLTVPHPLERFYPVCNEKPQVSRSIRTEDSPFRLELWLRDDSQTLEGTPNLETTYTFHLRRYRP